jgi:hypothetical protein
LDRLSALLLHSAAISRSLALPVRKTGNFTGPSTGANQTNSSRSAHNTEAKTNKISDMRSVLCLENLKGLSQLIPNGYAVVGDEALLHNTNKE